MKPYLMAYIGLPGSGKSTHAKFFASMDKNSIEISKDDLREELHSGQWSPENERQVVIEQNKRIAQALKSGKNVYVHDTNFGHAQRLEKLANDNGGILVWIDFTCVPVNECIQRDSKRSGKKQVGENVIVNMAKKNNLL